MRHEKNLKQVLAVLTSRQETQPITVRNFLSWFEVQRRTPLNVEYIDDILADVGIETVPHYEDTSLDSEISFQIKNLVESKNRTPKVTSDALAANDLAGSIGADDPSFKVGNLVKRDSILITVSPNDPVQVATTLMLIHNFSQIPVVTTSTKVNGVISWASIGARTVANVNSSQVDQFMDEPREISASSTVFEAIRIIQESGYVLVRDKKRNAILGILTGADIAEHFETISTPFLLLGDIENYLRSVVAENLVKSDIEAACSPEHLPKEYSKPSQLTYGNLVRILEHDANWLKVKVPLDRQTFCKSLREINRIRNDVMHFNPDPMGLKDIALLRKISRLSDQLTSLSSIRSKQKTD